MIDPSTLRLLEAEDSSSHIRILRLMVRTDLMRGSDVSSIETNLVHSLLMGVVALANAAQRMQVLDSSVRMR